MSDVLINTRQQEEYFEFFKILPTASFITNNEWNKIFYVTDLMLKYTENTMDEVINGAYSDSILLLFRKLFENKSFSGKTITEDSSYFDKKAGIERYLRCSVNIIKLSTLNSDTPESCYFCTITDCTADYQNNDKLRKSVKQMKQQNHIYQKIYNNVLCGVSRYSFVDGYYICESINNEGAKILGYLDSEDYMKKYKKNKTYHSSIEDRSYVIKSLNLIKSENDRIEFKNRFVRPDGTHGWLYGILTGIYLDNEFFIQSTFMDCSEQQAFSEAIQNERDLYNTLYNSAKCGLAEYVKTDFGNYFVNCNNEARNIFGINKESDKMVLLEDTIYIDDYETIIKGLSKLKKTGESFSCEHRIINISTGNITWVSGIAKMIKNTDGNDIIQVSFIDATERHELEENRIKEQRAVEALKIAEAENKAKSNFLANMSHDIRTPLNAIIGMSTIADVHRNNPDKVHDCMTKIDTSSKYLLKLINNVLDMSAIESGQMNLNVEITSISEQMQIIHDITNSLLSDKKITFDFDCYGFTFDRVYADALHINQVIINLISNAVKFTQPGGHIKISIKEDSVDKKHGYCDYVITVADNGKGMSEEFLNKLFVPFSRDDSSIEKKVEGTGLGMSIAKNIVDLMGGYITVDSKIDVGTTFKVYFSLKICEDQSSRNTSTLTKYNFSGKNILVAEDDELNMQIISELLELEHANVYSADNGLQAIELFQKSDINFFDIIFMDIQMPVMNGYDATKKIRSLSRSDAKTIKIIALTANAFNNDVMAGTNAGMDAHIPKPLDMKHLHDVMIRINN